ncbi:MAG: EamA family transporter [Candidatus Eremiobacteraeota bacterium]|nr:EamA family transporter [Candidatus Eremiobacteraeota bacterium]
MTESRERIAVVAAYAGMCAIWGTTWLGIKVSLRYVPPMTAVGLRFVLAALCLYTIAASRGRKPNATLPPFPWKLVLVLAVCFFGLNYVLTYVAETRLDSGLVAVLFGTLPFFVFAFGHVLVGEKTTRLTWLGACVAFAGVALISLSGESRGSLPFALVAICAAAVSAFGNVYAKRHSHHDPLRTLPAAMLIAGVAVGLAGVATERVVWSSVAAPQSLAALAYLAILGSGVAFFLNLWVLHRVPAGIVGLSALIIPVIAVVVGIAFGGESFTWRELAGSALVIAGVWIALRQSGFADDLVDG